MTIMLIYKRWHAAADIVSNLLVEKSQTNKNQNVPLQLNHYLSISRQAKGVKSLLMKVSVVQGTQSKVWIWIMILNYTVIFEGYSQFLNCSNWM